MGLSSDWPKDVEILLLIAAAGSGIAFGAKGVVLPVVGGVVLGIAWLVCVTPGTDASTGESPGPIFLFVVVMWTGVLGVAALAGAYARWVFRAARRDGDG